MHSKTFIQTLLQTEGTFYPILKTCEILFSSTETEKQGVIDWNGNLIWECPYGQNIESFDIIPVFGISHIMLNFYPKDYTGETIGNLLTGRAFTYDCRHPGLFVDSYQDYILKNRDYDIAMRKIQSDKEVWSQVGAGIEGVGYGMAFGGPVGAVASGLGGVAETAAKFLINEEFNPKIQKQYDQLYSRMTDQISLVGDAITGLQYVEPMYKYTLSMDSATQSRMKSDIETNGFYNDETVDNLQALFKDIKTTVGDYNVNPVFQADNVVVEGACNVIGKQQVVSRLMNGVEFI